MHVLEEFNISRKIITLTTDNDSAMIVCEKEISSAFNNKFLTLSLYSACIKFRSKKRIKNSQ